MPGLMVLVRIGEHDAALGLPYGNVEAGSELWVDLDTATDRWGWGLLEILSRVGPEIPAGKLRWCDQIRSDPQLAETIKRTAVDAVRQSWERNRDAYLNSSRLLTDIHRAAVVSLNDRQERDYLTSFTNLALYMVLCNATSDRPEPRTAAPGTHLH